MFKYLIHAWHATEKCLIWNLNLFVDYMSLGPAAYEAYATVFVDLGKLKIITYKSKSADSIIIIMITFHSNGNEVNNNRLILNRNEYNV